LNFTADAPCVCDIQPAINQEIRLGVDKPDMLILHYTGMETAQSALHWLCCKESGVSCHYFVFEDGRVVQMVPERARAWHAGVSVWKGESDINSRSVGIEISNPGHEFGYTPFPDLQIEAVIELCRDICRRNQILSQNILAHSDVAPGRKRDPGELFPWDRLFQSGVGHYVNPEPLSDGAIIRPGDEGDGVAKLQTQFMEYGYGVENTGKYDLRTEQVVTAFQRHFRPEKIDGIADFSTISTLRRLLEELPVTN